MLIRSPRDLGAAVRHQRRLQGLDQRTLADRAGVSRQWIVALEQGKSGAELGLVLRTVKVLGLDLEVAPPSIGDAADAEDVDIDAIVAAARTLK